jgi:60 kDa SS-A/Ro ribonucleoprotein
MVTKNLFSSKKSVKKSVKKAISSKITKVTDTINNAGGTAYSLSDKAALAQYAMTGCFNGTYYTSDKDQLNRTLELANKVDPEFVAKLAIYSRQKGLMKDMPAVLAAVVAGKNSELLTSIFSKVIDNPKMLRNFVQVIRSGATGRKSLGTRPKKLIQSYLENLTDEQLFKADVGNDPSLQDIIKMVHPRPTNKKRSALYAYLLDKKYNKRDLCSLAKEFESFKAELGKEIPDVPFQMLTALPLTDQHWKQIATNATWTQIRMNLNTFARHNVFENSSLIDQLAKKLSNAELVKKAKAFPYQLFTAFLNADSNVPVQLTNALQDAAVHALDNIPEVNGKVYVMVDTSGSMSHAVTGNRGSVTSKTRYIDVAAVFAAAILRKNPTAEIVPFDTTVHSHKLNSHDSIMTNAKTLAGFGGGGTNCSIALSHINKNNAKGDLVIYVSDNESWVDSDNTAYYRNSTATMQEWNKFKTRNPKAKLVCIDIAPGDSTQVHNREDILNVGGFSDQVFDVISHFIEKGNNKELWVDTIEAVQL